MKPSKSDLRNDDLAGLTHRPTPLGLHRSIMAQVAAAAFRRKEDLRTSTSIATALVLLCLGWYWAFHAYAAAGSPGVHVVAAFGSRHADALQLGLPLIWMLALATVAAMLHSIESGSRSRSYLENSGLSPESTSVR